MRTLRLVLGVEKVSGWNGTAAVSEVVAGSEGPGIRTSHWVRRVHQPETGAELDAVRISVNRSAPFGSKARPARIRRRRTRLGLQSTLAPEEDRRGADQIILTPFAQHTGRYLGNFRSSICISTVRRPLNSLTIGSNATRQRRCCLRSWMASPKPNPIAFIKTPLCRNEACR